MRRAIAANDPGIADDCALSFFLRKASVRGRILRLGPCFDAIVTRHRYPEPVAALLGQALAVAAALAGTLKLEGIFTLQAKGDGAVRTLVADVTDCGDLRGYIQLDAGKPPLGPVEQGERVSSLLGKGYLAFTLDPGADMERYQGIVELQPGGLDASVLHYFHQSEQIDTCLKSAAVHGPSGWRAGALLLQRMPASESNQPIDSDEWEYLKALVGTVSEIELTDPRLASEALLFRLFHEEDGARLGQIRRLQDKCRCSRGRIARVLLALPAEDREHLAVDGVVSVSCEFCSAHYSFDDRDMRRLPEIAL